MLLNPSPNDWLMYNRTYDSQRYSPLKQIDKSNVDQLRMVWTRGQGAGAQEGIPLVHNGVMYLMVSRRGDPGSRRYQRQSHLGIPAQAPRQSGEPGAREDHRHVGRHDLHHYAG